MCRRENKAYMSLEVFDDVCEGQISIEDIFEEKIPEKLFAVSKIFARARKQMTLPELKTLVYCLTEIKWTEKAPNMIYLDKKTLANILGIHSDTDHLSVDVFDNIKEMPKHSLLEFSDKDKGFFDTGFLIIRVTMLKNRIRIKFDDEYLKLFSGLEKDYITMWSGDIFRMSSTRSIEFYEQLRLNTDTRNEVNHADVGVKWFKELFNIPQEGKGSYMREKGGFDRNNFEHKVIDPICNDLAKCRMINLILQPDGKYYEKLKKNGRVVAYRFTWTYTSHPRVATATEVKQIQERVDKDPQILKVAKDLIDGDGKKKEKSGKDTKKNSFNNFNQREYDFEELEKQLLNKTFGVVED
jgi:hypothetical protein